MPWAHLRAGFNGQTHVCEIRENTELSKIKATGVVNAKSSPKVVSGVMGYGEL